MQRRQPSSYVSSTAFSGIRRRSGAQSTILTDRSPRILHSPNLYRTETPKEGGHDGQDTGSRTQEDQPTILLVPPPNSYPNLCILPLSPESNEEELSPGISYQSPGAEPALTHIALTPRPESDHGGDDKVSMKRTEESVPASRLPSPDFSAHSQTMHPSFFPRGLSFLSSSRQFIKQPGETITPCYPDLRAVPSLMSRVNSSSASFSSASSYASSSSVDSGHLSIIPSIGTTVKFTHKWPRPHSIRNMSTREVFRDANGGSSSLSVVELELEEGEGLGMDKIGRWTVHKWLILLSICSVFACGAGGLICAMAIWFRTWDHADVMNVADNDILILITLASCVLLFTSLIGITGTLLNSRPILAIYALLLWPALVSILTIGYTAYKRYAFSLDKKLNLAWSQYYTSLGRLLIQNSLNCCGYYNPLHEAVQSNRCYPRTQLPGCKGKLYRFEEDNLATIWSAAFSVVPLHIVNIFVSLLCANHVTRTFGKGLVPRQYRLSGMDVLADAEKIRNSILEGSIVTRPALSRASSSMVSREDKLHSF